MAVIQSGSSTTVLVVDSTHKAARVTARPDEATGHYRYAAKSGTVAAALAANAVVWSFRWVSVSKLCRVSSLKVRAQANAAFTAAGANLSLAAYAARAFSASHTGGTAVTASGNNLKLRTSFPQSEIGAAPGDLRISSTAALGGGTLTKDAHSFAYGGPGRMNDTNAAAGTENIQNQLEVGRIDYAPRVADGEYPLVLANNEGVIICNEVVWPAAGTAEISVEFQWAEVTDY